MPRYATLVAALTTWTGTLTARPSGTVMAPEIVPTEDCCAGRFAAARTKRGSHLMYGLYMPTLVLEVRSVGIVEARLTINRVRQLSRFGEESSVGHGVSWTIRHNHDSAARISITKRLAKKKPPGAPHPGATAYSH